MSLIGNVIRSYKTDENFAEAKNKTRKANAILHEASKDLQNAKDKFEQEQEEYIAIRKTVYKNIKKFAETFKTVDDVRFRESKMKGIEVSIISQEDISFINDMEFTAIESSSEISDGLGVLSMFLPIGIGDFGSFSSLHESEAAVYEAKAGLEEAKSTARRAESMVTIMNALKERCKLLADVMSGINNEWYEKAVDEFVNLVKSKNSIKYFFYNKDNESVFTDEEFAFIACLAALTKTLKSLVDVEIFTTTEKSDRMIHENKQLNETTTAVKNQIESDSSFGLIETYCGSLLAGEISSADFKRPGEYLPDDFEGTRARLQQEEYNVVSDFYNYVKNTKVIDKTDVKNTYIAICEPILYETMCKQIGRKLSQYREENIHPFGLKTLTCFKSALADTVPGNDEYEQLIQLLDDEISEVNGLKKKPFDGIDILTALCKGGYNVSANDKLKALGNKFNDSALQIGYKPPKMSDWAKAQSENSTQKTANSAADKEGQGASSFGLGVVLAILVFFVGDVFAQMENFLPVGIGLLLVSLIGIEVLYRTTDIVKNKSYLFIWVPSVLLFALSMMSILQEYGSRKLLGALITCGLTYIMNEHIYNKKKVFISPIFECVEEMLVIFSTVMFIVTATLMEEASFWNVVSIIVLTIVLFCVAASTSENKNPIINRISGLFIVASFLCVAYLLFGILHCILPFGTTFSLIVVTILHTIAGLIFVSE